MTRILGLAASWAMAGIADAEIVDIRTVPASASAFGLMDLRTAEAASRPNALFISMGISCLPEATMDCFRSDRQSLGSYW
ncbi:hypothetical protein D3C87_1868750 [compost metagenome]